MRSRRSVVDDRDASDTYRSRLVLESLVLWRVPGDELVQVVAKVGADGEHVGRDRVDGERGPEQLADDGFAYESALRDDVRGQHADEIAAFGDVDAEVRIRIGHFGQRTRTRIGHSAAIPRRDAYSSCRSCQP